jgi:HlyD family secretion protein
MARAKHAHWWYLGGLMVLAGVVAGGFLGARALHHGPAAHAAELAVPPASTAIRVESVSPAKGGLLRRTSQPGSAHSFQSADLYAKVSGFLKEQHVDIGSQVKKGDLLAELDVPELVKDVEAANAAQLQALAEVAQAAARVDSAIADQKASQSRVTQAKSDAERYQAEVKFAQRQYDRLKELYELKGIEERLVDEKHFQLQAALANQRAAESAVGAFEQQAAAAESRVRLARADTEVAKAKAKVAESQQERAKVMLAYTKITSPYDGVITSRNYHPGAFVRSPEQGGQVPVLSVDRTDLMRVQVRIPEREVPYIQPGDKVVIRFDALPGHEFSVPVARIAESEDPATRTMLAEIDVANPERRIRDHMYGRVEITLDDAQAGVTVPSACLVGDVASGEGQVFVVENGQARLRKVRIGRDTGAQVEILSGVGADERVVLRPPAGLADGAEVAATALAAAQAVAHK